MQDHDIAVRKTHADRLSPALIEQIDTIFFEASSRTFPPARSATPSASAGSAATCRGGGDVVFLALRATDTVAGYLVGALDNPAAQARFADIGYFREEFADLAGCSRPTCTSICPPPSAARASARRLIEVFAEQRAGVGRRRHAYRHGPGHAQRPLLRALRVSRARRLRPGKAARSYFSAGRCEPRDWEDLGRGRRTLDRQRSWIVAIDASQWSIGPRGPSAAA